MALRAGTLGIVAVVFVSQLSGCGNADEPYKAQPAWSGRKPNLPPVPQLPSVAIKTGDSYTVAGAIHQLNSRYHADEVTKKDITIQGYIIDSNIPNAPACAIHKVGKKDPDDCTSDIPSFWIADAKGDPGATKDKIRVLGWAKNFAVVNDAMDKYKGLKDPPKEAFKDDVWAVDVPFPLPAVGAKVKVTGKYGYTFSKASTGLVSDPRDGVVTYTKIETVEPATDPAAFKNKKP